MPSLPPRLVRALLVGAILALPLAACGRKGPLEPPPGSVNPKADPIAAQEAADAEDGQAVRTLAPTIQPVQGRGGRGRGKPIVAPKEPFFLDPIL